MIHPLMMVKIEVLIFCNEEKFFYLSVRELVVTAYDFKVQNYRAFLPVTSRCLKARLKGLGFHGPFGHGKKKKN